MSRTLSIPRWSIRQFVTTGSSISRAWSTEGYSGWFTALAQKIRQTQISSFEMLYHIIVVKYIYMYKWYIVYCVLSSPPSSVMDMWEKLASDDGRSAASWDYVGHEVLQHLLIIVVVTGKGLQLAFETYFYSQGQLWVLQANQVTCRMKRNMLLSLLNKCLTLYSFQMATGRS